MHTALYGKPYLGAAKDTWRLFKDRGIDAIVNDSLVGMSAYIVSYSSVTSLIHYCQTSAHMGSVCDWLVVLTICLPLPPL